MHRIFALFPFILHVAYSLNYTIYIEKDQNANITVSGTISIKQIEGSTTINSIVNLTGFEPNSVNGWHIHSLPVPRPEEGEGHDCGKTGSHFNPLNSTHGGVGSDTRHIGDLGNLIANAEGLVFVELEGPTVDTFDLFDTDITPVNRSIVIHAGEDDLGLGGDEGSLASGNSGSRIACGNIMSTKYADADPLPVEDNTDGQEIEGETDSSAMDTTKGKYLWPFFLWTLLVIYI